jgi:hypothetical protein
MRLSIGLVLLLGAASFAADPTPAPSGAAAFRTDATATDETLRWFQLTPGEFPPENSSHHVGGELISVDHINRTGEIRLDRDDTQRRGEWDRSLWFSMLPFGSIAYHGAPAELRDIPIGTHLHGQFYIEERARKNGKGNFDRVIRLEDDFSFCQRTKRTWRIDAVDLSKQILTCTGTEADGKADAKPTAFQIAPSTRVWKGHGIGDLKDLAAGQSVLLNLTVCTLKGPGRITDVWVDPESRDVAAAHQVEVHRQFEREHGLPAMVESVDNAAGVVTVILFDNVDRKLFEPFKVGTRVSAAVAEENLRTYDQINDSQGGAATEVKTVKPLGPGDSGLRVSFKPGILIEGFRPKKIVRVFWGGWKVDDLPREERLYQ